MSKKLMTLIVFGLLFLSLSSCCSGDDDCKQFNVRVEVFASDGHPLPIDLTKSKRLYVFVNGRFFDASLAVTDGIFNASFPSGSTYTFIGGAADETAYRFNAPTEGESIQDWYVEVIDYDNIPPLYYGSVTTTEGSDQLIVQMHDIRSRSRVLIRNMHRHYGAGEYQVYIGGLRRSISFEGIACGELVERHLDGVFQETSDHWFSNELISLPTAPGEGVNVRIQRADGEVITYRDVDDDGNLMALHPGDDVVFVITFGEQVSIRVVPWTEVFSDPLI